MKRWKPWVLLLTVLALALSATAAWAQETEDEEDTVFNFGYDSENKVFVWGSSSTEGTLDCTLAAGTYQVQYVTIDGTFYVDDLLFDSQPVTFPSRDDEAAEPAPYTAEGECGLSGGVVSGPNGQVNHGMFMKLFNSMFKGPGRGCLVRHLAQSDLGKGDQQVRVPEVGDEVITQPESGDMDIQSILTKCGLTDDEETEDAEQTESEATGGRPDHAGKGKPPWAGRPGGPNGNGNGEGRSGR